MSGYILLFLICILMLYVCSSIGKDIEEIAENTDLLSKTVCLLLYIAMVLICIGYCVAFVTTVVRYILR